MKLTTTMPTTIEITTREEFRKLLMKARKNDCEVYTKKFQLSFCSSWSVYIDIEEGGCYLRQERSTNEIIRILQSEWLLSFDK